MYGNVGAHDRLDFTVIGPAVNLCALLESLAGSLGEKIIC
jgi:adenylate cyclase